MENFQPENEHSDNAADVVIEKTKLIEDEAKQLCRPAPPPEPFLSWQTMLKDLWTGEDAKNTRHANIEDALSNIFGWVIDPYDVILGIYSTCYDYGIQKTSTLASFVANYARKWLGQCDRQNKYSKYLTLKRKHDAFVVATAKGTVNLSVFVDIYQLLCDEIVKEAYEKVQEMTDSNCINDALACATQFQLQSPLFLHSLVIPAVLQDRMQAVETYLAGHKDLQCQLTAYFDKLIRLSKREIKERFDCLISEKVMTIPIMRLQGKSLKKMVAKMHQHFDLPDSVVPNLAQSTEEGELRYILHKRFVEGAICEEAYLDYIIHALSLKPELRRFLVMYLTECLHDFQEALRWAVHFDMDSNLPKRLLPFLTRTNIDAARQSISKFLVSKQNICGPIYLFEGHPIIIIDNIDGLIKVADSVSKADIVGIDSEFKPSFLSLNEKVALMQISFQNCSYLLDMIALESVITVEQWREFFEKVFCSENTVKLGFDFANDLRALMFSFSSISLKIQNVICLKRLAESVIQDFPELLYPFETSELATDNNDSQVKSSIHFSLTDLSKKVLGQSLDKSEQSSDWAVRPLRLEQIRYAANDAHCLLKIYRILKERVMKLNPDSWEAHMEKANMGHKRPIKPKKSKSGKKKICTNDLQDMMKRMNVYFDNDLSLDTEKLKRPREIKLILDMMLSGLGKNLRRCGIDTLLPDSREMLIECALKEPDRFVITAGKSYHQLVNNRKLRGHSRIICFSLEQNVTAIQQIEHVFKYFHITLKEEDIFSRCVKCNSAGLLQVPSEILEAMRYSHECKTALNAKEDKLSKCREKLFSVESTWTIQSSGYGEISNLIATSQNCRLDITRCVAYVDEDDNGVMVKIERVPSQAYEKDVPFYICGSCGMVYWNDCQEENHNLSIDSLLENRYAVE